MPTDIVVSVVWTYSGMSAEEMQDRILIKHERQMASLVDDIARIEANSYTGVGVIGTSKRELQAALDAYWQPHRIMTDLHTRKGAPV